MQNFVLVGLSHHTADVGFRERVAFRTDGVQDAVRELAACSGVREAMIVSTCNRVELLCHTEDATTGACIVETFLSQTSRLSREDLGQKLYHHLGKQAIRHVFRVASSLDSMIVGEPQILGQLKQYYQAALDAQTVGIYLNTLLQAAFRVAKRVRSETSIGAFSVSVSSAAVELAGKVLGDLHEKSILIVGAGKMSEVAVRHLAAAGARHVRVTNRSLEAARELAAQFRGEAVPFEKMAATIGHSDIVIVSTGAPHFLIDRALVSRIMSERKRAPIVFIDISVPRNVDPSVAELDDVFCYDIDDLGAVVAANLQERRREALIAEKIVDQEVEAFCDRVSVFDVGPVIVQLRSRIEEICRMELDRYLRRNGPRDEQETRQLESMMDRIAGKIAHPLVAQIREAHGDPMHQRAYLETIKRIFKLQKDAE
jgi:glutamyl-tRNA reductase